jgi:hypothetical protein
MSLFALLAIPAAAHAQEVFNEADPPVTVTVKQTRFGAKAGFNSATVSSPGSSEIGYALNRRMGVNAGIFMLRRINERFSLQLEAAVSDKGVSIDTGSADATIELRYLSIPLMLRYELAPNAESVRPFVSAGMNLSFLLSARISGNDESIDIRSQAEEMEASATASAGFEIPQSKGALTFEARYSHGVTNVIHGQVGQQSETVKNRVATVLVGYVF